MLSHLEKWSENYRIKYMVTFSQKKNKKKKTRNQREGKKKVRPYFFCPVIQLNYISAPDLLNGTRGKDFLINMHCQVLTRFPVLTVEHTLYTPPFNLQQHLKFTVYADKEEENCLG